MKKRYVLLSYSNFSIDNFLGKARAIQTGLSNGIFSTVQPTPAEVLPLIDQMQSLANQTKLGNKLLIPDRNALRITITEMIDRQALAVNQLANGDMSILVQSGFSISKVRENWPMPTQGGTPEVVQLGNATVVLFSEGIDFQDFYELEIDGPNGFCKTYSGKHAKMKIADLPVGVVLKACIRGVNGRGQGEWSNSVSFIAYGSAQHDAAA